MRDTADVVIVGGGVIGTSIALALSRRRVGKVVLVEKDTIASGATGRSSGVIRCHYGIPALAAMAWESLQFFETANERLGQPVDFRQVGYVVLAGQNHIEAMQANIAMQQAIGVETQVVTHEDAMSLCPALSLDDVAAIAYEPRAGYGDPYTLAHAFANKAKQLGAVIRQRGTATRIVTTPDGGAVQGVVVNGELVSSRCVILAAGAWSVRLAATASVSLPIVAQREQILLIDPGVPSSPEWPVVSDLVALQYLRPEGRLVLLGNSDHSTPDVVDADACGNGSVSQSFVDRAIPKFQRRLPSLQNASLVSGYSGCYDVTPDYNPIMGHTSVAGLVICAGFSGHGFKLSPAVGELTAGIVAGDRVNDDFTLDRFTTGRLLNSLHPYSGAAQMR